MLCEIVRRAQEPAELLPERPELWVRHVLVGARGGRQRAQRLDEATAGTDTSEARAIEEEIRKFESRYGPASERRTKQYGG